MKKLKKGQHVLVEFYDHQSNPEWQDNVRKLVAEAPLCTAVGFVERQDEHALYLWHFGAGRESDLDTIITGAIKEIWPCDVVGRKPLWQKRRSQRKC